MQIKNIIIISLLVLVLSGCNSDETVSDMEKRIDSLGSEVEISDMYEIVDIYNAYYDDLTDEQAASIKNLDTFQKAVNSLDSYASESPYNKAIYYSKLIYNSYNKPDDFVINKVLYKNIDNEFFLINFTADGDEINACSFFADNQLSDLYLSGNEYDSIYSFIYDSEHKESESLNCDYITMYLNSDIDLNLPIENQGNDGSSVLSDEAPEPVTIEEQELYNDNGLKITATEYNEEANELEFTFENTSDLDLNISLKAYSVNNIMVDTGMLDLYVNLPSDSIAKGTLDVDFDEYSDMGYSLEYMEFLFWAYNDEKSYKEFETGQLELKTSAFTEYHMLNRDPDVSSGGIDVVIGDPDRSIDYLLYNDNNYYVCVDLDNIKLNKTAVQDKEYNFYDNFDFYILSKCCYLGEIELDDDFSFNEDLNSITFDLKTRENGDYFKESEQKIEYTF